MEDSGQMYFESLVGKWTLSNNTDTPGPFAPHEIMPLLHFLQDGSMSQRLQWCSTRSITGCSLIRGLGSYWSRPKQRRVTRSDSSWPAFLQPGVIEAFISQKDCDVVVKHKLLTPESETEPKSEPRSAVEAVRKRR